MKALLIIILFLLAAGHSYAQSQDSLLLIKSAHTKLLDSMVRSYDSKEIEIYIDNTGSTDSWNIHLFRVINYHRSKFKDAVLPGFSKSVFPMALLMPINTFIYGRVYNKTFDENSGYLLAASEITNFAFTYTAKLFFNEQRPYKVLMGVNEYTNLPLDPYAFPSAHTSFAFTTATTFALRYPKYPQLYAPIYMWGFLVAYSRPYLGVHYPGDVFAGMVIATVASALTYSLRSHLFKFKNNLFGENKQDEGSINGGVVTIFGASFFATELLTAYVLPDSPLLVSITPSPKDTRGVNITLNYGF